jgi:hypothetical protein
MSESRTSLLKTICSELQAHSKHSFNTSIYSGSSAITSHSFPFFFFFFIG